MVVTCFDFSKRWTLSCRGSGSVCSQCTLRWVYHFSWLHFDWLFKCPVQYGRIRLPFTIRVYTDCLSQFECTLLSLYCKFTIDWRVENITRVEHVSPRLPRVFFEVTRECMCISCWIPIGYWKTVKNCCTFWQVFIGFTNLVIHGDSSYADLPFNILIISFLAWKMRLDMKIDSFFEYILY